MGEEEYFSHERAMGLIKLMIRQLDEDFMSEALKDVLTGANSHSVYMAKFALNTALKDMELMANIRKEIEE